MEYFLYIFLAVQHERGPRKPKLQKDGTTQALVGSSHPNSNNNNSNMASLTGSVTGLHAQHVHGVHGAGLHIGHHPLHHHHHPYLLPPHSLHSTTPHSFAQGKEIFVR